MRGALKRMDGLLSQVAQNLDFCKYTFESHESTEYVRIKNVQTGQYVGKKFATTVPYLNRGSKS